jgi:hypothetical protein
VVAASVRGRRVKLGGGSTRHGFALGTRRVTNARTGVVSRHADEVLATTLAPT